MLHPVLLLRVIMKLYRWPDRETRPDRDRDARERPDIRRRDAREERDPSRRKRSRSPAREPDRRHRDRPKDSHRDKHRRTDSDRRRSADPQPHPSDPPTELNQREQDDIDKRAQRALAWQKLQAAKQTAPSMEPAEEEDDQKGWNLDDEAGFDEDEEETQVQPATKQAKEEEVMGMEEGGDEIDPLDAFMADNEAKVVPVKTEAANVAVKEEEDEVDPLDAFMMDNNAVAGVQQAPAIKPDPDTKPSTSGQD